MNPEIDVELLLKHIAKSDLLGREKLFLMELIQQSRWIPCSERMPEEIEGESEAVLAIVRLVDFNNCIFSENYQLAWLENGEWVHCPGRVTRWMPLSEPPKSCLSHRRRESITNREILFRGKCVDNGKWIYGYFERMNEYSYIANEEMRRVREVVYPETVGQFTGLYDSTKWESLSESEQREWLESHTADEWKGKRIFEGDIISVRYEGTDYAYGIPIKRVWYEQFEVFFDVAHYGWYTRHHLYKNDTHWLYEFAEECMIIGNIHDNPELLEKEK